MSIKNESIIVLLISFNVVTLAALICSLFVVFQPAPDISRVYDSGKREARILCEKEHIGGCEELVLASIDQGDFWLMTFFSVNKETNTRWAGYVMVDNRMKVRHISSDLEHCRTIRGTDCLL